MRRVYFDGTYAAAAEVMRVCATDRTWVVKSRDLTAAELAFLYDVCNEDVCGSRAHNEAGRLVKHESIGSPRFSEPRVATAEDLIARIAHDDAIPDDHKLDILSQKLRPCVRAACGRCNACVDAVRIAEEYGIYDLNEALEERRLLRTPHE